MPTTSTDRIIALLFTTGRLVKARLPRPHSDPLSFLKLRVLLFVKENEHPLPLMKDLADHLCITPPSATSLVNGLVRDRLLARHIDPSDRRSVHLSLTAGGRHLLKRSFQHMTAHLRTVLQHLDERERRDLTRILEKLAHTYGPPPHAPSAGERRASPPRQTDVRRRHSSRPVDIQKTIRT
jgi:DNA-binding MarR family transcriptional regulator